MRGRLFALLLMALLVVPAWAGDEKVPQGERVRQLEERVQDLEERLGDPEGKTEMSANDIKKLQRVQWSGYLQTRFETFQNSKNGTSVVDRFNVRRARLKLKARPSGDTVVVVSADFAGSPVLKDGYIAWLPLHSPELSPVLALGQMNWPFGLEVPVSSSVRETPERALWSRKLFDGERDMGFQFTSPAGHPVQLQLGVFNGAGINKTDTNSGKDVVGRLGWSPASSVDLGVSGYFGTTFVAAKGETQARTFVKNRYGGDVRIYLVDGITLKGEYVQARDLGKSPLGWLAQINVNLGKKTVFVTKFDRWDPDDGKDDSGRVDTLNVGLIQYLDTNLRAKVFWERPDEERN